MQGDSWKYMIIFLCFFSDFPEFPMCRARFSLFCRNSHCAVPNFYCSAEIPTVSLSLLWSRQTVYPYHTLISSWVEHSCLIQPVFLPIKPLLPVMVRKILAHFYYLSAHKNYSHYNGQKKEQFISSHTFHLLLYGKKLIPFCQFFSYPKANFTFYGQKYINKCSISFALQIGSCGDVFVLFPLPIALAYWFLQTYLTFPTILLLFMFSSGEFYPCYRLYLFLLVLVGIP